MNVSNKDKLNKSCDNYNKGKTTNMSECGRNHENINDNLSEKANSVQTSYKYRKNKDGYNTISSKDSYKNNHYYTQNDDDVSIEISENDNLICPNCLNCTLIEEKKRRDDLEKNRNYDNTNDNGYGLFDRNRNYDRELIDAKRRQREYNTNEALQNLARINAGLSNKDKLIQINENSRNPLNDGMPDYQYQRFQDEYARRQKMINDNINKYYPNMSNERPEIKSYYDNYVYNPKYGYKTDGYDSNANKYGDYIQKDINKKEYIKDLENQINYKNELKKREKEEERRRGQKQFEDMQRELKREEEERYIKAKKQKEELIKANMELINQKNKLKLKELEDKLKYRELYDRQNEEYKKELERKKLEKDRMREDVYNHNKNEYENRQKRKEREMYDNKGDNKLDTLEDIRYDERYGKGEGRYGEGYGKGDRRHGEGIGKGDRDKYDKGFGPQGKRKERMGRCCRCHRIFPRRLLTINRYFYKENRK